MAVIYIDQIACKMILRTIQKSELTMAVNYLPDFLEDAFVLEKEFCVTNLANFEQINLCLKDEFTRGDRLLFENP